MLDVDPELDEPERLEFPVLEEPWYVYPEPYEEPDVLEVSVPVVSEVKVPVLDSSEPILLDAQLVHEHPEPLLLLEVHDVIQDPLHEVQYLEHPPVQVPHAAEHPPVHVL